MKVHPLIDIPFLSLILKIILFSITFALVVLSVISYISYASNEKLLEQTKRSHTESRIALIKLEANVDSARESIENLFDKERNLRDRTEELRQEALKLERDWEIVKVYKRRIDETGKEINELRKRINTLGR